MMKDNINYLGSNMKKTKDSYYEIKQICKDLKENNLKKRVKEEGRFEDCLLYTSPSPRDRSISRMPSSA